MQNNLSATPNAATPGVTVTSNATANTKGVWTTLIATANYDVYGMTICVNNVFTSAAAIRMLVDIGIGANPNEVVIIPDLMVGANGNLNNGTGFLFLPIFVPKGTRISARCQDAVGGDTCNIMLFLHGGGRFPPWRSFSRAESIGTVNSGASGGLAHTAGSTGVESTWTNIGSVLAHNVEALMIMVQHDTNTTMTTLVYHVEIGIASVTLCEYLFFTMSTEVINMLVPAIPHYCHVPKGTQLMIRAECSGTAISLQYGILGLY